MSLCEFNQEQKIIQNEIKKFTQAEVDPVAGDIDKAAEFPGVVIEKLNKLGFLGAIIPEEYGGAGLDTMSLCVIIEELARASASVAMIIAIHNCFVAYPLIQYGTAQLKETYCKKLASGTIGGCVIHSTLDCISQFKTKMTDSKVQVSGVSDFVMNGAQAEVFLMPITKQDRECFAVFCGSEDLTKEQHQLLGLRSAGIVRMNAEKFEFPLNNVIDPDTDNSKFLGSIRAYKDIGLAAISLGIAEACYVAALAYSRERKQFNKTICEFPMVREMLVDMKTRIDTTRLLVYAAAQNLDQGANSPVPVYNARLFADETAVFSGTTSVQIHGGYGYTKDYPVERFFRDAKSVQVIGLPAYEIKEHIAKELLS